MVTVRDIMSTNFVTVKKRSKLTTAIKIMAENGMISILVKEQHKIIGIITDNDMLHKVLRAGKNYKKLYVEDVMSSPIFSVLPNDTVATLSKIMSTRNFRTFPVIENDQLLGVVTQMDIIKATHDVATQYDHFMFRESIITWLVLIGIIILVVIYFLQIGGF